MAKYKAPYMVVAVPTAEELAREATNAEAEAAREKTDRKRRGNAEKQARFRKSMKEQGYREVKHWEKTPAPGLVKPWGNLLPPLIQEGSAGVCERDPAIREAVNSMMDAFFVAMRGSDYTKEVSQEVWDVYRDIESLISPLGHKNRH